MMLRDKRREANGLPVLLSGLNNSECVDDVEGVLLVHGLAHLDELGKGNVLELLVSSDVDGDLLILSLAVTDDDNIGVLVILESSYTCSSCCRPV